MKHQWAPTCPCRLDFISRYADRAPHVTDLHKPRHSSDSAEITKALGRVGATAFNEHGLASLDAARQVLVIGSGDATTRRAFWMFDKSPGR